MTQYHALFILIFYLPFTASVADTSSAIRLGDFSQLDAASLAKNWQPLTFGSIEEHTDYSLVRENGIQIIKAKSVNAASGLTHQARFSPKEYPYLSWRWKVKNHLPGTDVTQKSGDDYAARIYVSFHYEIENLPQREQSRVNWYKFFHGKLPPLATLNYIWANKTMINNIVDSPYTRRVKMIVLKNMQSEVQQWHHEERNIYKDYIAAFGEEPNDVTSISIMTDTDNTQGETESYYGDITISKTPQLISKK